MVCLSLNFRSCKLYFSPLTAHSSQKNDGGDFVIVVVFVVVVVVVLLLFCLNIHRIAKWCTYSAGMAGAT